MLLLSLFAFLAGAGTALSPCSLPVLPALLSASATGGRRRPFGIVLGLAATFSLTIVGLAQVVDGVGLGTSLTRDLAIAALLLFGLALLIPAVGARLEAPLSRLSRLGPKRAGDGFVSGLGVGAALGFVHAPCAGPVLAAVIAVSAASGSTVVLGLAFSAGTAATLLVVALTGRRFLGRFAGLRGGRRLQRGLGAVLVLTAVAMVLSLDVRFQERLATSLPAFVINPTSALERSGAVEGRLAELRGAPKFASTTRDDDAAGAEATPGAPEAKALPVLGRAPEFTGVTRWLNGAPVSVAGQVASGKVTLIDFWTYTCINCLRTVPYLRAWNDRYATKGLTIVGVHAPEFSFEKKTANVEAAIRRLGLKYAVAQDNDMATWSAWGNQYWPAKYLIDAEGNVRYAHFGEGDYAETEKAIRSLLAEAGRTGLATDEAKPADVDVAFEGATPETYLGTERAKGFTTRLKEGAASYPRAPAALEPNTFALSGRWRVGPQSSTALRDARIDARFSAKSVFLVLAPPSSGRAGRVRVLLDGRPTRTIDVRSQRLYTLAELREPGEHRLTLEVSAGTAAYAFTFG